MIGAPQDNGAVGAAWVFTRTGSAWTQQGAKLTGSGESGEAQFGTSVALAASGGAVTALIGGPYNGYTGMASSAVGAAWLFTSSGSGFTPLQQLTASNESGGGMFGSSVALASTSAGSTALIGAPDDSGDVGAAWVFGNSGGTWTQQAELTGSGENGAGKFGSSVALSSADGATALIGARDDSGDIGAAWVFGNSGGTWTQQAELTGSGESGAGKFGESAALSADGADALVGGPDAASGAGSVWAFAAPPSIVIDGPSNGATYSRGQAVDADYECSPGVSAGTLAGCSGPVADGQPIDTSTPGAHTFTVTASDTDGATSTASAPTPCSARPQAEGRRRARPRRRRARPRRPRAAPERPATGAGRRPAERQRRRRDPADRMRRLDGGGARCTDRNL